MLFAVVWQREWSGALVAGIRTTEINSVIAVASVQGTQQKKHRAGWSCRGGTAAWCMLRDAYMERNVCIGQRGVCVFWFRTWWEEKCRGGRRPGWGLHLSTICVYCFALWTILQEMLRKARQQQQQQHNRKAKQHNTTRPKQSFFKEKLAASGGTRTHDISSPGDALTNWAAEAAQLAGPNPSYKSRSISTWWTGELKLWYAWHELSDWKCKCTWGCSVPQLEAHFIHYAYLFSVIHVMRIPYLNQYLCPHTNTHISVTESAAERAFTYIIAQFLLYRMA